MQSDALIDLALRLREMQVDLYVMLLGKLMAELELLSAHRVDRMWSEGEGDTITKLLEALELLVASLAI